MANDPISSTPELIFWVVGFALTLWLSLDTERALRIIDIRQFRQYQGWYVRFVRLLATFVTLGQGVQILNHLLHLSR